MTHCSETRGSRLCPGTRSAGREREQQLEARIEQIETRIGDIKALLGDPALYAAGADPTRPAALAAERDTLIAELSEACATWERVGEELAGV